MIKAVIFDCFGVLISDAFTKIVEDFRSTDPDKADQVAVLVRASNRGQIDPASYRQAVADLMGTTLEEHISRVNAAEVKNQELLDYIKKLRKSLKTGILSNVSKDGLQRRFTDEELSEYFDAVTASGDIGYAKPEADAYEIAADRLGVRLDECVFIDDREVFCQGAIDVGMQAIQYEDFKQMKSELEKLI